MFIVETNTVLTGWVNCWYVDDVLETFDSWEEANAEIVAHIKDLEDSDLSVSEYRIVEL